MQNMIDSYKSRLVGGKPESFDRFKLEDIANSWLLIESQISKVTFCEDNSHHNAKKINRPNLNSRIFRRHLKWTYCDWRDQEQGIWKQWNFWGSNWFFWRHWKWRNCWRNQESENSENEYGRFDLTFGLSLLWMLQLCVTYTGIQISYHFGVDLFESLFWRAWQRISILLFLWAQLLLIQWNCSSLNQVYKTSKNGWSWQIPSCCQRLSSMGNIPRIDFHNSGWNLWAHTNILFICFL